MALSAAAKHANIIKSLNSYIYTNLVTTDGLDVHFPGQRTVFTPSGATWAQVHYVLGMRREWMGAVTSSGDTGSLVHGLININCYEIIDQRAGISFALHTLRDTVRNRFAEGSAIGIQDYDTGGSPGVGHFVILDVHDHDIQDGFGPDDNGVAVWNLSITGDYLESV